MKIIFVLLTYVNWAAHGAAGPEPSEAKLNQVPGSETCLTHTQQIAYVGRLCFMVVLPKFYAALSLVTPSVRSDRLGKTDCYRTGIGEDFAETNSGDGTVRVRRAVQEVIPLE